MDKIKNFFKAIGNFFTSLFNLTFYTVHKEQTDKALKDISLSLSSINSSISNINSSLQGQSTRLENLGKELDKVKEGLQMELFASLQNLHSHLMNVKKYASSEDKADATRFYTQIHNLGKDGWSKRYYEEIMDLPESREEYYKRLNK